MIDKNDPRLTAYLLGELDESQSDEIQSALQESSELRDHFEGLRDTVDVLQGAFGALASDDDTLTDEQLAAVEAASKGEAPAVEAPPVEPPPKVTPVSMAPSKSTQTARRLAIAALVLCMAGLSFVAYQQPKLVSGIWVEKGRGQQGVESADESPGAETSVSQNTASEKTTSEKSVPDPVAVAEPSSDEPLAAESSVDVAVAEEKSMLRMQEVDNNESDASRAASSSGARISTQAETEESSVAADDPFGKDTGSNPFGDATPSAGEESSVMTVPVKEPVSQVYATEVPESANPAPMPTSEAPPAETAPAGGRGMSSRSAPVAEPMDEVLDAPDAKNMFLEFAEVPATAQRRSRAAVVPSLPTPPGSGGGGLGGGGGGGVSGREMDETGTEEMEMGGMGMGMMGMGMIGSMPNQSNANADAMKMEMGGRDGMGLEGMGMGGMGGMDADAVEIDREMEGRGDGMMGSGMGMPSPRPPTIGFDAISGLPSPDQDISSSSFQLSDGGDDEMDQMRIASGSTLVETEQAAPASLHTLQLRSSTATEELRSMLEAEPAAGGRNAPDERRVLDDVQLKVIPELGQIILKGNERDVQRVRRVIDQLETNDEVALEQRVSLLKESLNQGREILDASRQKKLAQPAKPKTWKPASASANRARLSIGHHDDLKLTARDTYVRIDGFRARVMFDLYYYNDRPQQLEGQFLLRLPDDASLHYFAFGATNVVPAPVPTQPPTPGKGGGAIPPPVDPAEQMLTALRDKTDSTGSDLARRASDPDYKSDSGSIFSGVKTAYVTPKQKAALAYEETVRRRVDPALVEWSGPGIFQTKVFPLMPRKLHRIVVGYDVTLKDDGDDRVFTLDLPENEAGGRVEFDVAALPGTEAKLTPEMDAFVSGGRAYYRYDAAPPRDYSVRLSGTESIVLNHTGELGDQYFATRILADLPEEAAKLESRQAVFLLDTSWSDRPVAFSRRLKLLESILVENRDSVDEFAVMMFNVQQRWWREEFVANNEENVAAFLKLADDLALEGATDLHSAITAAKTFALQDTTKSMPSPNLFLLSDAVATWGVTDLAALSQAAERGEVGGGALFTYQLAGQPSDRITMRLLADASGGAVFSVAENKELKSAAVAHRSRPWRLASVTAEGSTEVLVQSASDTIYPGQPLIVSGIGERTGPIQLEFERGAETKTLTVDPKLAVKSPAAARLYGQLAVERLEPHAAGLEQIAIAFARYFRVPGRTCSMVMLESEADYQRFGVSTSPEEDQLVIASTSVTRSIERLEAESRSKRANPRSRFVAWVDSLEKANLVKVSTALRLAIEQMPEDAFQFAPRPLECRGYLKSQMPQTYLDELALERPEFDSVMTEAEQMLIKFGADDALKTASTLIEAKPSDVDTLRSVAFRAFEWQRADQAAPLVWRIAEARPYQPQCLLLLGRAYAESGDLDSAMVCYDLVTAGNWNQRWASGARDIARAELLNVLTKLDPATSSIGGYARARERQVRKAVAEDGFDIAVIMHWNTDRTDVDLHVTEPGGEICYYQNRKTKLGGKITQDITQGLGPEMYVLSDAPAGEYHVEAKYFRQDQNRTKAPTETLFTVIRYLGEKNASVQTKRVTLNGTGQRQSIVRLNVKE